MANFVKPLDPHVFTEKKAKKPPACDHCKAKRVLCCRQPHGLPCPRCIEKGIQCTTTPTKRRNRQKAPLLNENTGDVSKLDDLSNIVRDTMVAYWESPGTAVQDLSSDVLDYASLLPLISSTSITPQLNFSWASKQTITNLLTAFRSVPQHFHPIIPAEELESQLTLCDYQMSLLLPQTRVLAYCTMAVAAIISDDQAIIGPKDSSPLPHPKGFLHFAVVEHDLRSWGERRDGMLLHMTEEAFTAAKEESIALEITKENAASCFLLDYLDKHVRHQSINMYGSVYMSQARYLIENFGHSRKGDQTTWASYALLSALDAVIAGRSVTFSREDEILFCGSDCPTVEEIIDQITRTGDYLRENAYYDYLRPFAVHVIRLSRHVASSLTGIHLRNSVFSESAYAEFIRYLTKLQNLLHLLLSFPMPPLISAEFMSYARPASLYVLVYAVYTELRRRVTQPDSFASTKETESNLNAMFGQMQRLAVNAAIEIAGYASKLTSLSCITHLPFALLREWALILMDETEIAQELEVDRITALAQLLRVLKLLGWSYVDRNHTVESIEFHLMGLLKNTQEDRRTIE